MGKIRRISTKSFGRERGGAAKKHQMHCMVQGLKSPESGVQALVRIVIATSGF
jgi:hypothetical protein